MHLSHDEEDYSLSLSKFESMLKTNKVLFFDSEEFEDIILHYMDIGKPSLAKKALKLGLEQHPKSFGLKLVQVEMLIFEDKLEQAEKLLNDLYAIEPTNEEVFIQKANICSKRDDHKQAVEFLKTALQYTDDYADVHNLLGMEYLFMDELELAKKHFIACLEEEPQEQSGLYNVIYCFEFLEQYQEAISFLKNYIEVNPYSEIAWHQLGRLNFTIQQYQDAYIAFDYATVIDDQFMGAFMEKAKALERLARYEEAIWNYQETIRLEDPTSYALLRIGKCFEKLGNNTEALNYYNQTVHEDPLLDKGWIAITDFYIRQENYQKALYYANKALSIDAENPFYWKRYAAINKELSLFEEAQEGYKKAVELGDTELDTILFWADTQLFIGEYQAAIETLVKANTLFSDHYEIEYRLAGLYYTTNNLTKGLYHLTNALHHNLKMISILEELFPTVFELQIVQETIIKFNK
ncbi:tetratricopeptide repeat protein [Flavobacterium oreochromis]|uniref:tetratricopeptide repeat protein n=3 Tax=Flavobacterium oreochromis TaxID=2906078 RepID=UPI001CE6F2FA|nr:tetratricopeptide repeat protein [Flavobacterium oreochromis]QYS86124.1 tetratricopeptide repeat protein [Flavobacterium oreochromis]QYS86184.1 tetratricopeptide repeat protein [Flavobacterium oreochromis]